MGLLTEVGKDFLDVDVWHARFEEEGDVLPLLEGLVHRGDLRHHTRLHRIRQMAKRCARLEPLKEGGCALRGGALRLRIGRDFQAEADHPLPELLRQLGVGGAAALDRRFEPTRGNLLVLFVIL